MIIKFFLVCLYVTIACLLAPPAVYILVKFIMGEYYFDWSEITDAFKNMYIITFKLWIFLIILSIILSFITLVLNT